MDRDTTSTAMVPQAGHARDRWYEVLDRRRRAAGWNMLRRVMLLERMDMLRPPLRPAPDEVEVIKLPFRESTAAPALWEETPGARFPAAGAGVDSRPLSPPSVCDDPRAAVPPAALGSDPRELARERLKNLSKEQRTQVLSYLVGWYESPATEDAVRDDFWSAVLGATGGARAVATLQRKQERGVA